MGFFDLNIPYTESDRHITNKAARKSTRLKLAVKAMELGYTGVAYNHTIKGVMSESDRCSISLFPLSSLIKLAPSLSATVKLHRDVLNLPFSAPFRQHTRLTVVVDNSSQSSALNSGNPVLKSYDIVAVRPMNQNAFDQACQVSEVDLIAIDFLDKLPFRLKQPMVKAAIERGVCFEITYSGLIMDVQTRRQVISNAKLLVDWTRGKNLVFASAAPSVTELRGPYDVANLSSLLGITAERAKAAVSKTCRSLLSNALRKKQFFKETIKVEPLSSAERVGIDGSGFDDWLKWDPISSGEGDLLLEDMEKSFNASKTVNKPIDFALALDKQPPHGLRIQDLFSGMKMLSQPPSDIAHSLSASEAVVPLAASVVPQEPTVLINLPEEYLGTVHTPDKHQKSSSEELKILSSTESIEILANASVNRAHSEPQNLCEVVSELSGMLADEIHYIADHTETTSACISVATNEIATPLRETNSFDLQRTELTSLSSDSPLVSQTVVVNEDLTDTDVKATRDALSLASSEGCLERELFRERRAESVAHAEGLPDFKSCEVVGSSSVGIQHPPEDTAMEDQLQTDEHDGMNFHDSLPERVRERQRISSGQVLSFPFKRLLNTPPFKRKARKFRNKVIATRDFPSYSF